jgi:hypothetical protein
VGAGHPLRAILQADDLMIGQGATDQDKHRLIDIMA